MQCPFRECPWEHLNIATQLLSVICTLVNAHGLVCSVLYLVVWSGLHGLVCVLYPVVWSGLCFIPRGLVWSVFYTSVVWSGLVWSGLYFIPNPIMAALDRVNTR
jgi:hypothetical protein